MRIEWSDLALADLDRLDAFLRPKNPQAADDAYFAIYQAAAQLVDFPEISRPALDMRLGELPVPFSNSGYTILYYYDEWVSIVRVRHQREAGY